MKWVKLISLLIVFLLIDSTFIYADLSDPIEAVETGVKKTGEALSTFEATDILINVDSYYPTVLSEKAFESDQPGGYSIFATLTGVKTNPLMDLQKIDSITIRPTGATTKYVNTIYYKKNPRGYFDLNNLGYVVIRLRKLKEDEVPKRLDVNMTAYINFQIQNGFGVNEQDLVLPVLSEEEFLNRKSEFSFYSGRGYVRLANIRGNSADLIVYDGLLNKESLNVQEGRASEKKFLTGGVPYLLFENNEDFIGRNLRNTYKIKVNQITGNKDKASVEMLFNGEYKLKEFVEGMSIYEGSKWKVNDIRKDKDGNDEVELINEDTREKLLMKGGELYVLEKEEGVSVEKAEDIEKWIKQYSEQYNVDPNLIKGLIYAESKWKKVWNFCARKLLDEKLHGWRNQPENIENLKKQDEIISKNTIECDTNGDHQIDPREKNIYTAYGYGQITKTTARDLSEDTDRRFDPESNIRMTVHYLWKLGITKNLDESSLRAALLEYTGGSGKNEGYSHIDDILSYREEYRTGKLKISASAQEEKKIGCCDSSYKLYGDLPLVPTTVLQCSNNFNECSQGGFKWIEGGKCNAKKCEKPQELIGPPEPPTEEDKEAKVKDRYNTLKGELDSLRIAKINNFDSILTILQGYKKLLDDVNDLRDKKLFVKYRNFVLNDIRRLDESYESNEEISNKISDYYPNLNVEYREEELADKKQPEETQYEEGTKEDYFEKAIENYRTVAKEYNGATYDEANLAMEAQLKIAKIYDYYLDKDAKAVDEYKTLLSKFNYPEADVIQNRINFLEKISMNYASNTVKIFEDGNSLSLALLDKVKTSKEDAKVTINVDGKPNEYSLEKDKNKLTEDGWYLKEINNDNVLIVKISVDKTTGENKEVDIKTLNLNDEESIGDKGIHKVILENIKLNQEVHVTILPGEERLTTQTDFMLHIPVEPRLWKLSTEQMNSHINATEKMINGLNNAINVIENIYKVWSLSCYGTFAVLWIKNTWLTFLTGGGARTQARKTIMGGWKEECTSLATDPKNGYGGDTLKCIIDKKEQIDKDLDIAQEVYSNKNNPDERIKELATKTFNNNKINEEYDEEAFNILIKERVEDKISGDNNNLKRESYIQNLKDNILNEEEKNQLKEDYGFKEELFAPYENLINPKSTAEDYEGVEEISTSRIHNGYIYATSNDVVPFYKIFEDESKKDGNNRYYIDNQGKRKYIKEVPTEVNTPVNHIQKVVLIKSGKFAGRVDKISVDSIAYLKVPEKGGRGGNGEPLNVELWGRDSNFGSKDNLPLGEESELYYPIGGPFSLSDCERGIISERAGVDILKSLNIQHPNLKKACEDLTKIDRQSVSKIKEQGEKIGDYLVESAIQETGGLQCFDIMDVGDCLTLFSVCDPVMCPVSRFTTGGWKVDNVVRTGIFGSIFLGKDLWDFKRVPPEVGICVPGIDAGLKNYKSLLEGYQQCLIARRDKGENVGICDTIRNVGVCKILWREGTSFVRLSGGVLDNLLSFTGISKTRGGGEYGYFQSNIQKTGDFLSFFTKEYATTYFSAYRGASTDEIGEELCKAAIYGKIPGRGDLLDQLTKPEGPAQFMGWFTETPHSDLAGQVISDYEVYYHIYAGEDREQVRYVVYLNDIDGLLKIDYITKTTGYLNRGDFVDETVSIQDATGYDELCIVIDNQQHCGFGKVSSDLALDYFEDKSLEAQARVKDIKTEQECVGESTVFTDPGVSSFVDALYPGMLDNGIIRRCSSENPGKGVDNSSWIDVGSCGQNSLNQNLGKCWLSKQSYKDALSQYDIGRRENAERFFKELAGVGLLTDEKAKQKIKDLIDRRNGLRKSKESEEKVREEFKDVINKFTELNTHTLNLDLNAKIYYEIGETYYELALYLTKEDIKKTPTKPTVAGEVSKVNSYKVELIVDHGIGFTDPNIWYIWDGSSWSFYVNSLVGKAEVHKLNDYESGLNQIQRDVKQNSVKKLNLYCDDKKEPNFILDKISKDIDVGDWVKINAKKCSEKEPTTKEEVISDVTLIKSECEKCGSGLLNICDKNECESIEDSCIFVDKSGLNGNLCLHLDKDITPVIYSLSFKEVSEVSDKNLFSLNGKSILVKYNYQSSGFYLANSYEQSGITSEEFISSLKLGINYIDVNNDNIIDFIVRYNLNKFDFEIYNNKIISKLESTTSNKEEIVVNTAEVCSKSEEGIQTGATCALSDTLTVETGGDTINVRDNGNVIPDSTIVIDTDKGVIVGDTNKKGKFEYFNLGDIINYNPAKDEWKLKKAHEFYFKGKYSPKDEQIMYDLLKYEIKESSEALHLAYSDKALGYIYSVPIFFGYGPFLKSNVCASYYHNLNILYVDLLEVEKESCGSFGMIMVHEVMHVFDYYSDVPNSVFDSDGIRNNINSKNHDSLSFKDVILSNVIYNRNKNIQFLIQNIKRYPTEAFEDEVIAEIMGDVIYGDIDDIVNNREKIDIDNKFVYYYVGGIPKSILNFYENIINPQYSYLLEKGY